MGRLHQYSNSVNAYEGLAASIVTSNTLFWGDAAMITGSLTTSSATASTWTIQGYEGDDAAGFRTALPAATASGWQTVKAVSAQGYLSIDTIPRWARVIRTPSHSSSTLYVSQYVGP